MFRLRSRAPYKIRVTDGVRSRDLSWTVYDTPARKAKNVILFIGDGMSPAHRVAARLLAKGIAEGKAFGKLAIDDMPHMAMVATAGSDSIITDSANSASAYATGHKSAVNAMGVYADRTADPFDDPKVETITSLVQRKLRHGGRHRHQHRDRGRDAGRHGGAYPPARRLRPIVEQFFAVKPDVLMGGGMANFLPRSADGLQAQGRDRLRRRSSATPAIRCATTAAEMTSLADAATTGKLLGLFTLGNMDGVLDRKFLKGGTVGKFPRAARPDRAGERRAEGAVAERERLLPDGRVRDDRQVHPPARHGARGLRHHHARQRRASSRATGRSARGDDTLILVLADHTHPISLVGTIDDDMATIPNVPMRERDRHL